MNRLEKYASERDLANALGPVNHVTRKIEEGIYLYFNDSGDRPEPAYWKDESFKLIPLYPRAPFTDGAKAGSYTYLLLDLNVVKAFQLYAERAKFFDLVDLVGVITDLKCIDFLKAGLLEKYAEDMRDY